MLAILSYAIAIIGGAILYAIGYKTVEAIFEHFKERGLPFGQSDKVNLSGTWYAAWQTEVEGREIINTEVLRIKQRGRKITIENLEKSPENKIGGYLWKGEARIYDNEHILGIYLATEPNVISKGTIYFLLNRVGHSMVGRWVGCNYDSDFIWGFGVIAKEKDVALRKIEALRTEEQRT